MKSKRRSGCEDMTLIRTKLKNNKIPALILAFVMFFQHIVFFGGSSDAFAFESGVDGVVYYHGEPIEQGMTLPADAGLEVVYEFETETLKEGTPSEFLCIEKILLIPSNLTADPEGQSFFTVYDSGGTPLPGGELKHNPDGSFTFKFEKEETPQEFLCGETEYGSAYGAVSQEDTVASGPGLFTVPLETYRAVIVIPCLIDENAAGALPADVTFMSGGEAVTVTVEPAAVFMRMSAAGSASDPEIIISINWLTAANGNIVEKTSHPGRHDDLPEAFLNLTPVNNAEQIVTLQVNFYLPPEPAERKAAPEELEIRIPMYLFERRNDGTTTWNGGRIVHTSLDSSWGDHDLRVQNQQHITGLKSYRDTSASAVHPGGDFVVTNWREFTTGDKGIIDIAYKYFPSNIEDGYENLDVNVVGVYRPAAGKPFPGTSPEDGIPEIGFEGRSEIFGLRVNTHVRRQTGFAANIISGAVYESWQTAWGPAAAGWPAAWGGTPAERELWRTRPDQWPANGALLNDQTRLASDGYFNPPVAPFPKNPNDYFYVVWRVRYAQNRYASTMPYDLSFYFDAEKIAAQGGTVVGISGVNLTTTADPGVTAPFVGQTAAQTDAARIENFRINPDQTNQTVYYHRQILVRYDRTLVPAGTTLSFDGWMSIAGIDANEDPWLIDGNAEPIIRDNPSSPATTWPAANNAANDAYPPHITVWGPLSCTQATCSLPCALHNSPGGTFNNNARYTHRNDKISATYRYVGVHFSYGGGLYSTSKANIWGNNYNSPNSRLYSALNRLRPENPGAGRPYADLTRNASDTYTFAVGASAQGWSLTRETDVIAVPNDIKWQTENAGWDWESILSTTGNRIEYLANDRAAVFAGTTLSTTSNPDYWEIFLLERDGLGELTGAATPLGFLRIGLNANILTANMNSLLPMEKIRREGFSTYYKLPFTAELRDSMFFLDGYRLKNNDYEITSTYLVYTEYVHSMNENSGAVSAVEAQDYLNYAPVLVQYRSRFGGVPSPLAWDNAHNGDWITAGTVLRNGATYTYTPAFGGAPQLQSPLLPLSASNQIIFTSDHGAYEIRYVHENSRYTVSMTAYFKVRLHATQNVMEILQGKTQAVLHNVSSMVVRDHLGVIRNENLHTRIYSASNGGNSVTDEPFKKEIVNHDHINFGTVFTNRGTWLTALESDKAAIPVYHADDRVVQHQVSYIYLLETPSSTVFGKTAGTVNDEGAAGRRTTVQTLEMYETITYNPAVVPGSTNAQKLASLEAEGLFSMQTEGVFYDLLPAGATIEPLSASSVVTYHSNNAGGRRDALDRYYTIDNWQGTGRTMLVVYAKAPAAPVSVYNPNYQILSYAGYDEARSGFTLTFTMVVSYATINDRATDGNYAVTNEAAYRSPNGNLISGKASPNTYFQNISGGGSAGNRDDGNRNTVYSSAEINFPVSTVAVFGIDKKVKSPIDTIFGERTQTILNGLYTYQLRFQSSRSVTTSSRDVVFYDVMENQNGDWKGTVHNVDIAFAQSRGVGPKIYYSVAEGLQPVRTEDSRYVRSAESCLMARIIDGEITAPPLCVSNAYGHPHVCEWEEENGEPVWILVPPSEIINGVWLVPPELARQVTAIAVDLSKAVNGIDDIVFMNGESVVCYVTMRAPNEKKDGDAVNRMSYFTNQTPVNNGVPVEGGIVVPSAAMSNNTYVSMDNLSFGINKISNPAGGSSPASPAPVNDGDIIEYVLRLENLTAFPVGDDQILGLEVADDIPDGLEIMADDI
ncbi:MAG: hypothetical protein FWE82_02735, partial [Defluviitaleaceae bacterium]|nr:hypothetical protein [Defluviitaleaceae bacterium]